MKTSKGLSDCSDDELYLRARGIVTVCNMIFWGMVLFSGLDTICLVFSLCRMLDTFIMLFLVLWLIILFFGVGTLAVRHIIMESYDALRQTSRPNLKSIEMY